MPQQCALAGRDILDVSAFCVNSRLAQATERGHDSELGADGFPSAPRVTESWVLGNLGRTLRWDPHHHHCRDEAPHVGGTDLEVGRAGRRPKRGG